MTDTDILLILKERKELRAELERLKAENAELREELKFCLPYVRGAAALFNRARELVKP